MPLHRGPLLVDTNVILEAHACACWAALAGGYAVETVEACVEETQPVRQLRDPFIPVDERALRASLRKVHEVDDEALAHVILNGGDDLHYGEQRLWAHALTRQDAWVLCGPDIGSMKFAHESGMGTRILTLEGLLSEINFRPPRRLHAHYGRRWHAELMTDLILGKLRR